MKTFFQTPRLLAREFTLEDFDAVHDYAKEKEVVQYQAWGPNDNDDTLLFLEEAMSNIYEHPRLTYEMCLVHKANKQVIGGCGLYIQDENFNEAKIGYIINPKYWNQGFATEATLSLLEYAHTKLGLKVIKATCDTRNKASQRVLEKSGFQLEKIIEDDYIQKGVKRDSCLYRFY
jgi:RimJ/RimL family protein N-acetyltransferase